MYIFHYITPIRSIVVYIQFSYFLQQEINTFTRQGCIQFTFMHLADAFIQSDLHCILSYSFTFYQLLLSLGIEPMILALLAPCSTIWATGKPVDQIDQKWQ